MGVVDEAVENGVGIGRVADDFGGRICPSERRRSCRRRPTTVDVAGRPEVRVAPTSSPTPDAGQK